MTTATEHDVTVRLATADDRDELRGLLRAAAVEVAGARGAMSRTLALPGEVDQLLARLDEDSQLCVLVAEGPTSLIGFALVAIDRSQLVAVHVTSAERRQGIGRALVAASMAQCQRQGKGPFSVLAAAGDRAEKSLYESLGFRAELLVMAPRMSATVVDQQP